MLLCPSPNKSIAGPLEKINSSQCKQVVWQACCGKARPACFETFNIRSTFSHRRQSRSQCHKYHPRYYYYLYVVCTSTSLQLSSFSNNVTPRGGYDQDNEDVHFILQLMVILLLFHSTTTLHKLST